MTVTNVCYGGKTVTSPHDCQFHKGHGVPVNASIAELRDEMVLVSASGFAGNSRLYYFGDKNQLG